MVQSSYEAKPYEKRILGSFFTPIEVASSLIQDICNQMKPSKYSEQIKVCDPFCGDGRLLTWIGKELITRFPDKDIYLEGWEIDPESAESAKKQISKMSNTYANISYKIILGDSFVRGVSPDCRFDIVITNPPWEAVKPDWRELKKYPDGVADDIKRQLKELDTKLAVDFPYSQPSRKFAGWGTNLSRVGLELSLGLLNNKGILGIVMPTSFFADLTSQKLRDHMFDKFLLKKATYYPAESHLFDLVDTEFATCLVINYPDDNSLDFAIFTDSGILDNGSVSLTSENISLLDGKIPIRFGSPPYSILDKFSNYVALNELSSKETNKIWGGREIDETRIKEKFTSGDGIPIMFSRDMERYKIRTQRSRLNQISRIHETNSSKFPRIVWRDIARPSMKRRMHATLVDKDILTGNSLGVLHFGNEDRKSLLCLLGVMNSFVFEYQVRTKLATNHITWGLIKNLRVPSLDILIKHKVNELVERISDGEGCELTLESMIAKLYGLDIKDYSVILESFDKLTENSREEMRRNFCELNIVGE